jgi:hypothetical protein
VRRLRLHRPSAATVISLIALCFAMGGTAVAATGGNFILGKANTATSVSSLTNTKGTALSLSSSSTAPPLKVGDSVEVPKLNVSELDGHTSSAFLPAKGTAANSSKLGGVSASEYMQGGGDTTGKRFSMLSQTLATLLTGAGADLLATCDPNGTGSGTAFIVQGNTGAVAGTTALWWNKDGVGADTALTNGATASVSPSAGVTTPYVVVVQVDNVTSISTFTASGWYDSGSHTCHVTGQVVTTNV